MKPEEIEDIKSAITAAASAAVTTQIQAELGQYKVPKEQHYQDHIWLSDLRNWTDSIKNSAIKTVVSSIVGGCIFLLILGFLIWGRQNLNP